MRKEIEVYEGEIYRQEGWAGDNFYIDGENILSITGDFENKIVRLTIEVIKNENIN
jgi:hypothetical protein